jgi:hypothetical protein
VFVPLFDNRRNAVFVFDEVRKPFLKLRYQGIGGGLGKPSGFSGAACRTAITLIADTVDPLLRVNPVADIKTMTASKMLLFFIDLLPLYFYERGEQPRP